MFGGVGVVLVHRTWYTEPGTPNLVHRTGTDSVLNSLTFWLLAIFIATTVG
jgi:preprotein translocase subunit SecG